MKKLLLGLGILVVLLGGGMFYVLSNLNSIVERIIETSGTNAVGSEVAVDGVDIKLKDGDASILGFTVDNPAGFSSNDMISFDELSVDIDVSSLTSDVIRINSVVARIPFVRFETGQGSSNLQKVSERFASEPAAPAESSSGDSPVLSIGTIRIEDIQGVISDERLSSDVNVNLGDIVLNDLEGTPAQIARQIMRPLATQLGNRALESLLDMNIGELTDAARARLEEQQERLEQELNDRRSDVEDSINQRLEESGIGDFLNRN